MKYTVRLVIQVETDDGPDEAVRLFVDNLVVSGLVNWVYRAEESDSGRISGYYNGLGVAADITGDAPVSSGRNESGDPTGNSRGSLTDLIEVDTERAARDGVVFRSLHAEAEEYESSNLRPDLHVRGEIVPSGADMPSQLDLCLSVFDEEGRLVGEAVHSLWGDRFDGFETFHLVEEVRDVSSVRRLRLHTQVQRR